MSAARNDKIVEQLEDAAQARASGAFTTGGNDSHGDQVCRRFLPRGAQNNFILQPWRHELKDLGIPAVLDGQQLPAALGETY